MITKTSLALFALAFGAVPLSAQIVVRNPTRDRVIVRTSEDAARDNQRVPRGHLPPKGMCRVWIDGVPPGQQPPVTDCATAEGNRTANSRVIYGDREAFPGRGKGKFKRVAGGEVDDVDDDNRLEKQRQREAKAIEKQQKREAKALRKANSVDAERRLSLLRASLLMDDGNMTKEHRWTIDSIEEFVAHVQVDGRQIMHVPQWMLPRGARAGDVLAVRHEVTAEHSVLKIERDESGSNAARAS